MSEARVFGEARMIGEKNWHPIGMSVYYDMPERATHILVRPVSKRSKINVFVAFFRAGLLVDYKPKNNAGKYFCRPDGAQRCIVAVYPCPAGWNYDIQWLDGVK